MICDVVTFATTRRTTMPVETRSQAKQRQEPTAEQTPAERKEPTQTTAPAFRICVDNLDTNMNELMRCICNRIEIYSKMFQKTNKHDKETGTDNALTILTDMFVFVDRVFDLICEAKCERLIETFNAWPLSLKMTILGVDQYKSSPKRIACFRAMDSVQHIANVYLRREFLI